MTGEDRWTGLGQVAVIAAWAISALAWLLSYRTTMILAAGRGRFHGWEVATFPLTVDMASLAAMVIALDQAKRRRPSRAAWCLSTFAAAAMMACNVGAEAGHPAAMAMHAYPPAVALMCWGLLTRYRTSLAASVDMDRDMDTRVDTGSTRHRDQPARPADTSGHSPAGTAGSTASNGNGTAPAARPTPVDSRRDIQVDIGNGHNGPMTYQAATAQLASQGQTATDRAVADLMGVSTKTVQRHRKAASNGSGG